MRAPAIRQHPARSGYCSDFSVADIRAADWFWPELPRPSPPTHVVCADAAKAQAEFEAKVQEAQKAGVEAVVYGLPLVIMDITKDKTTKVSKPEAFAAPVNQFVNVRAFPDASFKDVVRANVDTLYSSAFLDLSKEPIVLTT